MGQESAQQECTGSSQHLPMRMFAHVDMNELYRMVQVRGANSLTKVKLCEMAESRIEVEKLPQKYLQLLCIANRIKCSRKSNHEMISYLKAAAMAIETEGMRNDTESMCTEAEAKLKEELKIKDSIISQAIEEVHKLKEELKIKDSIIQQGIEEVHKLKDEVRIRNELLHESEQLRKKMLNNILELKGNIRVFVRVRPLKALRVGDYNHISYPQTLELNGRAINVSHNDKVSSYVYDKVFGPQAKQVDVYAELSDLVFTAIDGYQVCLFTYGQTGSGKTFTMIGEPGADTKGIIPRSLEQVFDRLDCMIEWTYHVHVAAGEIYLDGIHDLLAPSHSKMGGIDFVETLVFTIAHASEILKKALCERSVRYTEMNEKSSRGHFMFRLRISGFHKETGQSVEGFLNFMDLAGSEKVKKSGSVGESFNEATAINCDLLYLLGVFTAIQNKSEHIPFRNCKLTQLLKPFFTTEGSNVLMLANIAPEISSINETLNSLDFASKVKEVKVGRHGERGVRKEVQSASILSPNRLPLPSCKRKEVQSSSILSPNILPLHSRRKKEVQSSHGSKK